MGKDVEGANTYRVGHPLAQRVIDLAKGLPTPLRTVVFGYRQAGKKISILESLLGKSGWLACSRFSLSAIEPEDHLVLAGCLLDGTPLTEDQCRRLFDIPGVPAGTAPADQVPQTFLEDVSMMIRQELLADQAGRNGQWFDLEMDKLERWAEDRRTSLKSELADLDDQLKIARKAARQAPTLPEKLERQREIRTLEGRRDEAWRAFDAASRDVDRQKEAVLDEISRRLTQTTEYETLFILRWTLS
jgi:hypothetical protein